MGYLVKFKGLPGLYEPIEQKEKPIKVGDYLRLPDGRVFLFKTRTPYEFVQMNTEPPEDARIHEFRRYFG